MVLHSWLRGKIPYCHLPPRAKDAEGKEIDEDAVQTNNDVSAVRAKIESALMPRISQNLAKIQRNADTVEPLEKDTAAAFTAGDDGSDHEDDATAVGDAADEPAKEFDTASELSNADELTSPEKPTASKKKAAKKPLTDAEAEKAAATVDPEDWDAIYASVTGQTVTGPAPVAEGEDAETAA
ncbi:hypothetical protein CAUPRSCDRAFT_13102, partial [Caulochytrium protostelioides]